MEDAGNLEKYYYHCNALGSAALLTDSSGLVVERYENDTYGNSTAFDFNFANPGPESLFGNPYRFTSRHFDGESGLYYYRARHYHPTQGRFLQRDPIGYNDPVGLLNLYSYVGNNPVNRTDPSGLRIPHFQDSNAISFAKRIADTEYTVQRFGALSTVMTTNTFCWQIASDYILFKKRADTGKDKTYNVLLRDDFREIWDRFCAREFGDILKFRNQRQPEVSKEPVARGSGIAAAIMYSEYRRMRLGNIKFSDKYFHCYAACYGSRASIITARIIAETREIMDHFKGDTIDVCNADRKANEQGFRCPVNNSCAECCANLVEPKNPGIWIELEKKNLLRDDEKAYIKMKKVN